MASFVCAGVFVGSMSACLKIIICILSSRMLRAVLDKMIASATMYMMASPKNVRLFSV